MSERWGLTREVAETICAEYPRYNPWDRSRLAYWWDYDSEEVRAWMTIHSPQEAWDQCVRADWLIWMAMQATVPQALISQAMDACAHIYVLHHFVPGPFWPCDASGHEMTEKQITTLRHLAEWAIRAVYAGDDSPETIGLFPEVRQLKRNDERSGWVGWARHTVMKPGLCDLIREIIPFPQGL